MRINIFYTFLGNQIIQYIQIITIKITAGGVAKLMQSAVNICMYVCMYVVQFKWWVHTGQSKIPTNGIWINRDIVG